MTSQTEGPDDVLAPYDAVLLLSFGGPEGPEDVMPFLRNVTRGRGIPDERLAEVAEHYLHFGGRSPINEQNRELLAALEAELRRRGSAVPVVWGNRNWAPFVTDTLREVARACGGSARVLSVATSAYSSYSGCRQYREDLASAVLALAEEGLQVATDKARHCFNHPGFVAAVAEGLVAELQALAPQRARPVFVTHSVPEAMNDASGSAGGAYLTQHRQTCAAVVSHAARLRPDLLAPDEPWDLVFCSRSGPPSQPWLEPDVNAHLERLATEGTAAVVVVPVGFVSDHMEVRFDLDTEAADTARRSGLAFRRSATPGVHPAFVAALAELLLERAAESREEPVPAPVVPGMQVTPAVCPTGCCANLRAQRPAAAGEDWRDPVPVPR